MNIHEGALSMNIHEGRGLSIAYLNLKIIIIIIIMSSKRYILACVLFEDS